ncbi:AsmA family protein [Varunaivibrio sulfuroxidans]|uniref:Uncharacterized protein involved in outer membrane biogenesis n=1 Tax=Varunaivibrio sulfuroxidans TaxID=1773489 RepID=A0A4R3J9C7_9PROT|nr:AsmA family protein [Varunaivibrio sulfuroxidans]TCS62084.1 uncharacterized protein involved in outer membrane biogenesis [Varunaivibrio sulfuroxidans]WES30517.1 AsmA family protein [Varunaivibrio sulfuroxidans]
MRRVLKIAGVTMLLVVAVAVSAVVMLSQMDFNRFKDTISAEVKAATGRDLKITGNITLKTALTPTLSVDGVTFANASWSQTPTMATVRHVEARLDLWPLLLGTVHIQHLAIDGVTILAEVGADGKANWEFPSVSRTPPAENTADMGAPSTGEGVFVPRISDIAMRNVRVRFVNHRDAQDVTLSLDRLNARAQTYDAPIRWDVLGRLGDAEVAAVARTGSLRQLLESGRETFPVYLELKGPGLSVKMEGGVDQPAQGLGVDIAVSAQVMNTQRLARALGASMPVVAETTVNFNLKGAGAHYGFGDIAVHSGRSDLGGRLDVDFSGARPKLTADLTAVRLDLDQILPGWDGASTATDVSQGGAPDKRLFSAAPLPWGMLKQVDVTASISLGKLIAHRTEIDHVEAQFAISDGELNSKTLSAELGGTKVDGVLSASVADQEPRLALRLESRALDVGSMLKLLGQPPYLDLKLDGDIDVHGTGRSVRQIMATLGGRVLLVGRDGRLNDTTLQAAMTGLQNVLPWINDQNATAINCTVARFDVYRGLATAQALMMDTTALDAWGRGSADLRDEKLDFSVSTSAKNVSLAKLALPFKIQGTFLEPKVTTDVGGAVAGALGVVGGVLSTPAQLLGSLVGARGDATALSASCLKALGNASGQPKTPETSRPGNASPRTPQSTPLNLPSGDLGKGVEGLVKGVIGR